jgi:hypothetical protein
MVDGSGFAVGHNLATTPGAVVFRNELIELIHYAPLAAQVHAVPLVFVPPWINKFYILDLNEKKSMVRHLLKQGFSVFVISWRNPDASMADTSFEDYVLRGVLAGIEAARALCGVPQVHAIGYCLGGTALATLMAWLNREYEGRPGMPVASWTMLASLVDFSRAGEIETFLNEEGIRKVEEVLKRKGYLDGREMSATFRLLRPNSLIWHYFVHSYLYGEKPPALDVLYWNTDTTRLPRAMHSFYLRNCYVKNALAQRDGICIAPPDRSAARGAAAVRSRLGRRPHHALARHVQDLHAGGRPGALRTVHLGAHPRHHQPAGQSAQTRLLGRRLERGNRRQGVARPAAAARRQLVAGLDPLARPALRSAAATAADRNRRIPGPVPGARHLRAATLSGATANSVVCNPARIPGTAAFCRPAPRA